MPAKKKRTRARKTNNLYRRAIKNTVDLPIVQPKYVRGAAQGNFVFDGYDQRVMVYRR